MSDRYRAFLVDTCRKTPQKLNLANKFNQETNRGKETALNMLATRAVECYTYSQSLRSVFRCY